MIALVGLLALVAVLVVVSMVGQQLAELLLAREGDVVLDSHRSVGSFVGAPLADTAIHADIAYGCDSVLKDFETHPTDTGDTVHKQLVGEHEWLVRDG